MSKNTLRAFTPGYFSEYTGTTTIVVASVFIPLQVAFVCLRAYSRSLGKSDVGADDVLIWASLVTCVALDAFGIAMIKFGGAGWHTVALHVLEKDGTILLWSRMLLAAEWLYFLSVALPKICILTLYLRIFIHEAFRAICYAMITIITCTFLVNGLTGTLVCPMRTSVSPLSGHCDLDTGLFFRWASFPNIITDIVMLVLPLPTVWGLHLPKTQKLGLTVTFVMGSIGLIASCIRFSSYFANINAEPVFVSSALLVWTIIEPGMYLIAACLLQLRPLLQLLLKSAWIARVFTGKIAPRPDIQVSRPIVVPKNLMAARTTEGRESDVPDTSYCDERGLRASQFYNRALDIRSTFVGSQKSLGSKDSSDRAAVRGVPVVAAY